MDQTKRDDYVKPTATLKKVDSLGVKEPEITSALKTKIVALKHINEFSVRKLLHSSRKYSRKVLADMREAGELKTYAERYSELHAPKEVEAL